MVTEIITELSTFFKSEEVTTFLTERGLKPIAHIERYCEQYMPDVEGNVLVLPVPAILFEFDFDFGDDGSLSQRGNGLLRLHILQENYAWAETSSSDFQEAMQTYDYVEAIHFLLHGKSGDSFGKMQRRRWKPAINTKINIVDVPEYAFMVVDDTTNRYASYTSNGGEGTLQITKKLAEKLPKEPAPILPKYSI